MRPCGYLSCGIIWMPGSREGGSCVNQRLPVLCCYSCSVKPGCLTFTVYMLLQSVKSFIRCLGSQTRSAPLTRYKVWYWFVCLSREAFLPSFSLFHAPEISCVNWDNPFALLAFQSEVPDNVLKDIDDVCLAERAVHRSECHISSFSTGFFNFFERILRHCWLVLRFDYGIHQNSTPNWSWRT